jgi:hypothetical protein
MIVIGVDVHQALRLRGRCRRGGLIGSWPPGQLYRFARLTAVSSSP